MNIRRKMVLLIIMFSMIFNICFCKDTYAENVMAQYRTVNINSEYNLNFLQMIESKPVKYNYWYLVESGLKLKGYKVYGAAISKFESVISSLIRDKSYTNVAIMYKNIAECYANMGYYDRAYLSSLAEAEYWDKAGNKYQSLQASTKADFFEYDIQLYAISQDPEKSQIKNYHAPLEPKEGILLGTYAENDANVHQPYTNAKFYMYDFPELVGKDHAAYLLYFTYGMNLSAYNSHFKIAKSMGKVIELAVQPLKGLDEVNDEDGYLIQLAKDMEHSGVKFMLRFANEMNDPSNPWYTTDYEKYKSKFRMVARIFKEYAPSVAIVWAPNYSPTYTIENYYPGDEYVDYVGISSYKNYNAKNDPLNQNIDRSRWSTQLDFIYSIYGDRKPIIISECGCSYKDRVTGEDITDYTVKQLTDFYTYLPIKYPNIKAVFYFDAPTKVTNYCLSTNAELLDAYKQAIENKYFLSNYMDAYNINEYYYPITGNTVSSTETSICSYVKCVYDDVCKVQYEINDNVIGVSDKVPYRVSCRFSKYKGQKVNMVVKGFNEEGKLVVMKRSQFRVLCKLKN